MCLSLLHLSCLNHCLTLIHRHKDCFAHPLLDMVCHSQQNRHIKLLCQNVSILLLAVPALRLTLDCLNISAPGLCSRMLCHSITRLNQQCLNVTSQKIATPLLNQTGCGIQFLNSEMLLTAKTRLALLCQCLALLCLHNHCFT